MTFKYRLESVLRTAIFVALSIIFAWTGIAKAEATAGDLIKCPDFSSVYYLAEDGTRNVFPDEATYFSWYDDFGDVKEISCEDLSNLPIGELVPYQAGTELVTTPTMNDVYAVEPNGVLRLIKDEEMARELYGDDWASRVSDIADTFFTHYSISDPLDDGELPDGMFIEDTDGNLYRVSDGEAVEIDDVISEAKQAFFNQDALNMDEIRNTMDALGVDFSVQNFSEDMMSEFTTKMLPWMKTVDSGSQTEENSLSLGEIEDQSQSSSKDELTTTTSDDADEDGLKDFWETYIDSYDNAQDENYWDDAFSEWDNKGYDVYYNNYWEDFKGEMDYEDWYDGWKEYEDDYGDDGYKHWYEDNYDTGANDNGTDVTQKDMNENDGGMANDESETADTETSDDERDNTKTDTTDEIINEPDSSADINVDAEDENIDTTETSNDNQNKFGNQDTSNNEGDKIDD